MPDDELTKTKRRLRPREIVSILELKLGERYGTKIPLRMLKRSFYKTTTRELAKKFVSTLTLWQATYPVTRVPLGISRAEL